MNSVLVVCPGTTKLSLYGSIFLLVPADVSIALGNGNGKAAGMETEAAANEEKYGQGAQVLTSGGPPAQEVGGKAER